MTMTPAFTYSATVDRVVDADTIDVTLDLGWRIFFAVRLRVAGIDAPERYTPEGREAMAFVLQMMPVGTSVVIRSYKPDKYGRALADIQVGDVDLATHLIGAGHAVPYNGGARG